MQSVNGKAEPYKPMPDDGTRAERNPATASVQGAVSFPEGPPATDRAQLGTLSLTGSAAQPSQFERVPADVVKLVASFVAYPSQVALAATSNTMLKTANSNVSYVHLHAMLGPAMRQIGTLGRELHSSLQVQWVELNRYMEDDADALGTSSAEWDDLRGQRDALGEQVALDQVRLTDFQNKLGLQLVEHVDRYISTRASDETRTFVLACDQFVAATDDESRKKIFDNQIAGLIKPGSGPNLAHIRQALQTAHAAGNFVQLHELVRNEVIRIRADVATTMCKSWSLELAELFRGSGGTGHQPPVATSNNGSGPAPF